MAAGRRLGAPRGRARWGCRAGFFAVFSWQPRTGGLPGPAPCGRILPWRGGGSRYNGRPLFRQSMNRSDMEHDKGGPSAPAAAGEILQPGIPGFCTRTSTTPRACGTWRRTRSPACGHRILGLAGRYAAWRAAPDSLDPKTASALLVGAGPRRVGLPLARLFRVEEACELLRLGVRVHDPVFRFKLEFVRRRALAHFKAGADLEPGAARDAERDPGRTDGAPGVALRGTGPDRRRGQCDRSCGAGGGTGPAGAGGVTGRAGEGDPAGSVGAGAAGSRPAGAPSVLPGFGRPRPRRRDGPLRLAAPRRRGAPQGPRRRAAPARAPRPLPRFPQDRTRRPPRRVSLRSFPLPRTRARSGSGQPGRLGREAERRGGCGRAPHPRPRRRDRSSRRAAPGAHGALVRGARCTIPRSGARCGAGCRSAFPEPVRHDALVEFVRPHPAPLPELFVGPGGTPAPRATASS